ncbi:MAG: hypothetical protein IT222_00230 [Crocinitomix sp.]|nr:hypothetical protein [Crocinitomix sp.]
MDSNKDYKGLFWIPEGDKPQANGHLKFSKGYAYLDLFGAFDDLSKGIKGEKRNHVNYIFAHIDNQHCCIFYNCRLSQNSSYIPYTLVNFDYFIHASTDNLINGKIDIDRAFVKLAHLKRWVNYDHFSHLWEQDRLVGIETKKTNELKNDLYENDDFSLKVWHETSLPFISPSIDYLLAQESKLEIQIKGEVQLADIFVFLEKINDLFILLFSAPISLLNEIQFARDKDHETYYCYRNNKRSNLNPNLKGEFPKRPIFDLETLRNNMETQTFLGNWFKLYKNLSHPLELLIKSLETKDLNQENKFLNLMYAIDCIRPKIDQEKKSEFTLSTKEKKLLDKLETDYNVRQNELSQLQALLEKKKYSQLKEKFGSLLNPFKKQIEEFIKEDLSEFIEITVNTRNFLAHENDSVPRLESNQYPVYCSKLEAILVFYFCQLCEFPLEILTKSIKNHRSFN